MAKAGRPAKEDNAIIHVVGNYYIENDPYQWIVYENSGKVDKTKGEPIRERATYHDSFDNALVNIRNRIIKAALRGKNMELDEAIRIVKDESKKFMKVVEIIKDLR